jgi:hypothetical protein
MTEICVGLDAYREQLRRAVERDLDRRGRAARRRRVSLRVAVPAAGAVAAGALAVALTGGAPVQSADAAILHRVAAALTSPPATILHERALVIGSTTQPYELWEENLPPYHFHVLKWGHQGVGTARAYHDPAAELRSLVRSGKAVADGAATLNGVPACRLTISGASDRFFNGTALVAESDCRPLEVDTSADGGERIVFQTYQYLPATAANLQLVQAAAGR